MEADTWTETLQTVEDGNLCPQYDISHSEPIGKTKSFSLSLFLKSVFRPKCCDGSIVKLFLPGPDPDIFAFNALNTELRNN